MTETTIGTAVLQIIPSLRGVSEAINKELDGKVIAVQIEPKTDAAKVEKSVKDAVKKKPVEVELEPKVDKSKIDSAVKDAEKKANPPEVHLDPKIDPKKIEQTVEDAVKKTRGSKFELPEFKLPEFNARDIGSKLRGAVLDGMREINNNPALKDVQEQIGKQVGAAVGKKIGETIRESAIGREVADAFQPVIDKAGEAQQKFGPLKESIEGSTTGLLTLTNNSGKIAGGLTAISGAAGPLAATLAAASAVVPGLHEHLMNIQRDGGNFKDWVNTLFPSTDWLEAMLRTGTPWDSSPRIQTPVTPKPGIPAPPGPLIPPAFEPPNNAPPDVTCWPSLGMTTTGCCAVVDPADVVVGVGVGLILVVCTVSVSRN